MGGGGGNKRLNNIALVGFECCCTRLLHSIASRTKTQHMMTHHCSDNMNPQVILHFSKSCTSHKLEAGHSHLKRVHTPKFNSFNCHKGKQDCNILILELSIKRYAFTRKATTYSYILERPSSGTYSSWYQPLERKQMKCTRKVNPS